MATEVVHTKTKDRTLTDNVYESPVDEYEIRARRKLAWIALAVFLLLLALVFFV
jgi:hypothetical protein